MKITILCDDRCSLEHLSSEHGFSCLLEFDDDSLLIDCGQTDIFLNNAKKLNINLEKTKDVLITHGHYDHGNGLNFINNRNVYLNKNCFLERISKNRNKFGEKTHKSSGLNFKPNRFNNFIFIEENKEIKPNIFLLANIERKNNFEAKEFPATFKDGSDDTVEDEISVAIRTKKGLVIISGCAHSGICNTIEYAKKTLNEQKIYCVIGGFHLRKLNESSAKTINYFKKNKIGKIYMGHCNIDEAINLFKSDLKNSSVESLYSGMVIEI